MNVYQDQNIKNHKNLDNKFIKNFKKDNNK